MSDLSLLSHEYKTASEFSQQLSEAIVAVKKRVLGLPGGSSISAQELEHHRTYIAEVLEGIAALLSPGSPTKTQSRIHIPHAIISQLRTERLGDLDYLIEDLVNAARKLRGVPVRLEPADLQLLDHLSAIADAQTSQVFRRLMRK